MLGLEALIEAPGDSLHVEACLDAPRHIHQRQALLFLQAKGDRLQLLDQGLAGLVAVEGLLTRRGRPARLALHPLPHLLRLVRVGVDDQVLVDRLCDLGFDLAARRVGWNLAVRRGRAAERRQAALVRHGLQVEFLAVRGDHQFLPVLIPAQLFDEEGAEIEVLQVTTSASGVKWHDAFPTFVADSRSAPASR